MEAAAEPKDGQDQPARIRGLNPFHKTGKPAHINPREPAGDEAAQGGAEAGFEGKNRTGGIGWWKI